MARTNAADRALLARLFQAVHTGTPGDLACYRALCQGAASVLELGCGAGRVLQGLAGAVPRLVGLDRSPEHLALAAAASPDARLVTGDMCAFHLDERFDRVLIPYNGLWALGGEAGVVACLAAAAAHLTPDGRVIFDVYVPPDAWEADEDFGHLATLEDPVAGLIHVLERERPGPHGGWAVDYRFLLPDGRSLAQRIVHHPLPPDRLLVAVVAAGLALDGPLRDLDGAPVGPDAEHLVAVAGRAGGEAPGSAA